MTRPALVWTLLFCIILVNGLVAAPSVGHAGHHADHQAGTHSTGICAWLCAAGQGIESASVPPISKPQFIERAAMVHFEAIPHPFSLNRFLRGPPALS